VNGAPHNQKTNTFEILLPIHQDAESRSRLGQGPEQEDEDEGAAALEILLSSLRASNERRGKFETSFLEVVDADIRCYNRTGLSSIL
jgi:hypothetical protein